MTPDDEIIERVMRLMDWDRDKAFRWFKTPNPHLGNSSPEALVRANRAHKVLSFIQSVEEDSK